MSDHAFAVAGIHHVQLAAPRGSEQACRAFWSDVVGLTEATKPAPLVPRGGCWFRGNGVEIHVGVEDDFTPARKAHPALVVAGLDALAAKLSAAGYPVSWDETLFGHRRFHSADPFGNRLEFLEPVTP